MSASWRNGLLAGLVLAITFVLSGLLVWTNMRGEPLRLTGDPDTQAMWQAHPPQTGANIPAELTERYLQARYLWRRRGRQDLATAEEMLRQILRDAPGYADAHAAFAAVHIVWSSRHGHSMERMDLAGRAARRALLLDPEQAEALAVLGLIAAGERRFSRALEQLELAASLSPGDATIRQWLATLLAELGYMKRALDIALSAVEADPVAASLHFVIADIYQMLGNNQRMLEYRQTAGRLGYPDHADENMRRPELGLFYQYALLGETEQAMDVLLERLDDADFWPGIVWYPAASEVRRHTGFVTALEQAGLTSVWETEGLPDLCRSVGRRSVCR